MSAAATAMRRLLKEARELSLRPPEGVLAVPLDDSSPFEWEAVVLGPPDTPYADGVFSATLSFPRDYPHNPPRMVFRSRMWHPNVYSNGTVCISILHAGVDPTRYESVEERWSPVQSVEKILISVMSMLAEPNDESPANLDAAISWRSDPAGFRRRVDDTVRESLGLQ